MKSRRRSSPVRNARAQRMMASATSNNASGMWLINLVLLFALVMVLPVGVVWMDSPVQSARAIVEETDQDPFGPVKGWDKPAEDVPVVPEGFETYTYEKPILPDHVEEHALVAEKALVPMVVQPKERKAVSQLCVDTGGDKPPSVATECLTLRFESMLVGLGKVLMANKLLEQATNPALAHSCQHEDGLDPAREAGVVVAAWNIWMNEAVSLQKDFEQVRAKLVLQGDLHTSCDSEAYKYLPVIASMQTYHLHLMKLAREEKRKIEAYLK